MAAGSYATSTDLDRNCDQSESSVHRDGERVLDYRFASRSDPGLHDDVVRAWGNIEARVDGRTVRRTIGQLTIDIDCHGIDAAVGVGSSDETHW